MKRRGFTLIEMLVVVSILLILLGILIPTLGAARENGKRTACRNNLHNAGLLFAQFAADSEGWFPWAGKRPRDDIADNGFMDSQQGFDVAITNLAARSLAGAPSMWVCPSDKVDGAANNIGVSAAKSFVRPPFNEFQNVSYMYIVGFGDKCAADPVASPVMADESNGIENGAATPGQMPDITANDNHGADYRNVLYFDSHATGVKGSDVANAIFKPLEYDPTILQGLQSID